MTTNAKDEDGSVIVKVKHASSAGDFLPFTALPKRFHGKRVSITIIADDCSISGIVYPTYDVDKNELFDSMPPWTLNSSPDSPS